MSNFDDERQNIENDTYEQIKNTGKIGSKMAYKTTTKAGKKLIARKGYKKFTGSLIKGGKAIGKGLLSFGKAFILAIKTLLAIFLSWGWILVLALIVVVLFWVLMPALKQYTFDSINDEPGIFETNVNLTKENKSLENYFQFYSDKALTQNKVALFYNDVDYRKSGRELFNELNNKEYIIGPRKPTQIVPPGNTNNSTTSGSNNDIIGNVSIGTGATKALLDEAQKHLDKRYVWGAKGPNTFDCSGFIYYCMKQIIPGTTYSTSSDLRTKTPRKERSQLQPGDFVFYHDGANTLDSTVDHVAIYMGKINGEDKIIHSSQTAGKVVISKLPSNSSKRHYTYGRNPSLPLPSEDENSKLSENNNSQEDSNAKSINIFSNLFSKSKTNTDTNTNTNTNTKKNPSDITVVIDAGHGGKDPGAVGSYANEKDINLSVSKLVEEKLKQLGYKTIMTRTGDTYPTIGDRYRLSNQYGDLFISIHCNSTEAKTTSATGGLTMYWHNKDFGQYIHNGYINSVNIKDRGAKHVKEVRDDTVSVLENATKPAALVELAFINNIDEEKLLTSSSFQEKAATGIVNGLNNYVNNVPIDTSNKNPNYVDINSSQTSLDNILKSLKEMEGFLAEETINKLQQYWVSIAKPTLGWDWNTEELKKELNELINYSYDIKNFKDLDINKFTYLKNEQLSDNVELKDKYHREQYFNLTPELLYSLNNSLYKEKFLHTDSLIKPVKTTMVNGKIQLDGNAFILDNDKSINYLIEDEDWYKEEKDLSKEFKESIDSYLNKNEENEEDKKLPKEDYNKYGLGTVFVYRPMITFNIERGIEINQVEIRTEITTTNEDGTTTTTEKVDSKPSGRVIDNIDCKIDYVLERAITFEGEYVFKYEQVVNVLDEKNIENLHFGEVVTGTLIQSKKYEVTEIPSDIIFQDKGRTYIYNYLDNFKSNIPEDITKGIHIDKIIETFYEYKSISDLNKEVSQSQLQSSENNGSSTAKLEEWRPLCEEYGKKYGIDPDILMAIIYNESKGDLYMYDGMSTKLSWGLVQIINYTSGEHNLKQNDYGAYFNNKDKLNETHPAYTNQSLPGFIINKNNKKNDDRTPNCQGKHHYTTCAECERVARLNIEYLAQRLTAQLGMFFNSFDNLNINNSSDKEKIKNHVINKTPQMIDAFYFTICGYNQGEYGQRKLYQKHGSDLYASWQNYDKYFRASGAAGTSTYLKKALEDYQMITGRNLISSLDLKDDSGNSVYNPDLWYPHVSVKGSGNGSGSGDNNGLSNEELEKIEEISEEVYNRVKKYEEYEQYGLLGKLTRFSTSLDSDKVELTLALATALKEEISMTSIQDANYSFWDSEYIKDNFINGLPKGRNFKDYDRGKNSNKDWKKILNTVEYIRNNIGATRIGRIIDLDTSQVIGHAYEINANINVPKTPLEIKQKIKTRVENGADIQLGDILLLKSKNVIDVMDEEPNYITETAIFIGEENGQYKFAIVQNKVLTTFDLETIQEFFEIDSIVRPITSQYTPQNETSSNPGAGDYPFTPGEWAWPTTVLTLASDFGPRNLGYGSTDHKGIDINNDLNGGLSKAQGPPIYATKSGTVTKIVTGHSNVGLDGGGKSWGNYVRINHGNGMESLSAHLYPNSITVKEGDIVQQGQLIGYMGNSGGSKGTHLHFEIYKDGKQVDPEFYLTFPEGVKIHRHGGSNNLPYQHGQGYIDPPKR